ncbi:ComF family protein [Arthrobacter sp. GCM10027362]|uniref:ComF family protein n=1 Tax=Arthrobacter sp. GCM10027362 TaxID=3273379 RepID=UPI00363C8AF3
MVRPCIALASALDEFYHRPAARVLRRWWSDFGRLILPTDCAGCSAPDESLCPDCRRRLRRATARPYRAEAGAESLPFLDDCPEDVPGGFELHHRQILPVVAAGRYRHELALAILAFKNHGRTGLAPVLAAALGRAVHEAAGQLRGAGAGPLLLVPVPSRPGTRRRRGYEPLGVLLHRLERHALLPPDTVLLPAVTIPVRPRARLHGLLGGPSQKALGRSARRRNVSGSMRVGPRFCRVLAGRSCLLVDDVLTTGATLAELARVVRQAGGRVVGGTVLAATSAPAGNPPAPHQPSANSTA